MFEKLLQVEEKYDKINGLLYLPETLNDREGYKKLMRELKELTPVVETFRSYKKAKADELSAQKLLESESDGEMKALLLDEIEDCKEKAEALSKELKILLLPKDPNDDKNVIVEIRAGAGGEEAALFAGSLYRMYTMYAESRGFKSEVLSLNETGLGGIKEISFSISGEGAYSRLKFESGVHPSSSLAISRNSLSRELSASISFASVKSEFAFLYSRNFSTIGVSVFASRISFLYSS